MNVISLSNALGFGERAKTSGVVTLQGMLTIFLVLSLLWAAIEIMHRIIHKTPEKKKEETPAAMSDTNPDAAIAAAIAAALAAGEDDGATVAAITAAIIAARAEEGCTTPFRVVSFKRANSRRKF